MKITFRWHAFKNVNLNRKFSYFVTWYIVQNHDTNNKQANVYIKYNFNDFISLGLQLQ